MSKDLKKEYIEMIREDVPDLWDRISASLPEKEPEKPKKTKIYRFAVLAAACLVVAIMIPVFVMNRNNTQNSMSTAVQTETAAAEEPENMIRSGTGNTADEQIEIPDGYDMAPNTKSVKSEDVRTQTFKLNDETEFYSEEDDREEAAAEEAYEPEMAATAAEAYEPEAAAETAEAYEPEAAATAEEAYEPEAAATAAGIQTAGTEKASLDYGGTAVCYESVKLEITEAGYGTAFTYKARVLEDKESIVNSDADTKDQPGLAKGEVILLRQDEETPEELQKKLIQGEYILDLEQGEDEAGETIYYIRGQTQIPE